MRFSSGAHSSGHKRIASLSINIPMGRKNLLELPNVIN